MPYGPTFMAYVGDIVLQRNRQKKRALRLAFSVRKLPGGVGSKSTFPPKVIFPWVSKEGTWDVREFGRDIPDPGDSKSLCKRSLYSSFDPSTNNMGGVWCFPVEPFISRYCVSSPLLL